MSNPQATGHGGGHDLHYRTLQEMGVQLTGRLAGFDGRRAQFAPDLADSVAFGDARYSEMCNLFREACARQGITPPELPDPEPFNATPPDHLELAGVGAAIFTSGFRPGYASWVHLDAFDEMGFPLQQDGASTSEPGLYFIGTHFLRKRKSSLLLGVGEDAAIIAERVASRG
jgi:putative flavoprotein involved in K+ transport